MMKPCMNASKQLLLKQGLSIIVPRSILKLHPRAEANNLHFQAANTTILPKDCWVFLLIGSHVLLQPPCRRSESQKDHHAVIVGF